MPITRPSRSPRTHPAFSAAAAVAVIAVVAAPLTPAAARESRDASGKCAGARSAAQGAATGQGGTRPAEGGSVDRGRARSAGAASAERDRPVGAAEGELTEKDRPRFTATAQADLAKISVLDAGVLRPDLPSLVDVRLAAAHGSADSAARRARTTASGRYADAKLLGMQLPGLPSPGSVAERQAPPNRQAATAELASLQAAGLATVQLGRSTAEARWLDTYNCGATGPLTRTATMVAGVQLLSGGGRTPALQALRRPGDTARKTSLLRLGPTGSTQSATDLVRLGDGRRGVSAAAGVALSDLTLFGGTPQEVSIKVVTQPTLTVVATGDRKRSSVEYRPALLKVTAAGKPIATLDTADAGIGVDLFGGLTPKSATGAEAGAAVEPALLSTRISLGSPRQAIGDRDVRAEVAALRVEVLLGKAHLLDVALGYLYAQASTAPAMVAGAPAPHATKPGKTIEAPEEEVEELPQVVAKPSKAAAAAKAVGEPQATQTAEGTDPAEVSALARTGNNVFAVVTGGAVLLILGIAALTFARHRRQG
ncbi:hypothetical protein [Paractinoplanes atraurantiacus]|uniref:LPXTG-motif cell wall anchor domain-containing protein n=1 Tax=Paractinoplanes atraurantiacus TaxID=1036182 RepID=A0A285J5P7_9ACTN|nr:hypothetical protein [Actinoplanes atraurantiacus]SNY54421.1 hypothetical protein SAMN05421748_11569 [Actinoplanes atraurantiacus]